jgi:hypothetical protein
MSELLKYLRVQWDRAGAIACAIAGIAMLIVGYVGTSGTEYIAEQIPYLVSGGLTGVILLAAAAVLWISADLRDEWRELAEQGETLRSIEAEISRRAAQG